MSRSKIQTSHPITYQLIMQSFNADSEVVYSEVDSDDKDADLIFAKDDEADVDVVTNESDSWEEDGGFEVITSEAEHNPDEEDSAENDANKDESDSWEYDDFDVSTTVQVDHLPDDYDKTENDESYEVDCKMYIRA